MTALQSLNLTNRNLEKTQNTISTGYKVNEASDNAAYWAIATTLRSDTSALSSVQESLGLGAGQIDVSYTAVNNSINIVQQIRDKLNSARQDTVDKKLVQTDIDALQEQLLTVANSATYSGQNWLVASSIGSATGTAQIVSSYSRNSVGSAVVGTIDIDLSQLRLFHSTAGGGSTSVLGSVFAIDISAMTSGQIGAEMDKAAKAITDLTTVATKLGSAKSRIALQETFVKDLTDAIDRGISSLVDADMNEQSTKLQALQVQQQLGVQALSIANQSSQSILKLFQ